MDPLRSEDSKLQQLAAAQARVAGLEALRRNFPSSGAALKPTRAPRVRRWAIVPHLPASWLVHSE